MNLRRSEVLKARGFEGAYNFRFFQNRAADGTFAEARAQQGAPLVALACHCGNRGWRGLVFYGSGQADGQKTSYLAETVTRGNIENAITAVGTLSALRSINVGAQVSGQLKSVKVEVGDQVKQGQLIAEIDPSPFEKRWKSRAPSSTISRHSF